MSARAARRLARGNGTCQSTQLLRRRRGDDGTDLSRRRCRTRATAPSFWRTAPAPGRRIRSWSAFAEALAARGIDVVTFDFLYVAAGRRAPDRNDALEACWRAALASARDEWGGRVPFIGGKSMGGRIASHLAAAGDARAGLVLPRLSAASAEAAGEAAHGAPAER